MALLTRIKSPEWIDGDTLTAADLIAEFNNLVNGLNGAADISVLDITCDDITGDVFTANSAVVSGTANVAGNINANANVNVVGSINYASQLELGRIDNLGLSLSSGILKIVDASGANLSATNYGFIVMPSTTAGRAVSLKVNSNSISIQDAAGSSDFTNLEWGVTAAANWAQDVPFALYAINRGDAAFDGTNGNSAIAISRNYAMKITPSNASNFGDTVAIALTDDQNAVMLLGSYTEANYVNLPCKLIGFVRMQYATSTHDWTIQTLAAGTDGLGPSVIEHTFATIYTSPTGQNGADSGKFFTVTDGGTALTFASTNLCTYMIHPDGEASVFYSFDNQSVAGADNTQVRWFAPYVAIGQNYQGAGSGRAIIGAVSTVVFMYTLNGNAYVLALSDSGGLVRDNDFSDTSDVFHGRVNYKAY